MHTIDSVKQRLIDYLASVDLSKLTMADLSGYAFIVSQIQAEKQRENDLWRLAGIGLNAFDNDHKKEMN